MCARSQFAGGSCESGPSPDGSCCRPIPKCQPVRSVRASRGVAVRWAASVTVGILLLGLSLAGGVWVANPGDLTNQHTEIGDCSTCHSAFEKGVRGWLHAALGPSTAAKDSKRCVTCHQLGDNAMRPHSISPEAALLITESAQQPSESGGALSVKVGAAMFGQSHLSGEMACMSCHREHQGADFDLTQMANQKCMSCHVARFDNFSSGHADFSNYPFGRRTRIAFDHVSHIGKHFQDADYLEAAPVGCNSCHRPDPVGRTMQVSGFDEVCSACHLDQIVGEGRASAKGILVFGVPGLDVETLYDRGVALGEWPEFAEETVSPFAELLLMADPNFIAAYEAVKDHDLLDLSDADDATLEKVAEIAWSFKELMLDLTTHGADTVRERLESVIGRPLEEHEAADLVGMLPVDMMLNAQRNWFPSLADEIALHRRGEDVVSPGADSEAEQVAAATTSESGKYLRSIKLVKDLLVGGADDDLMSDGGDDDLLGEGADDDLLSDGGDDDLLGEGAADSDDLLGLESDDDDALEDQSGTTDEVEFEAVSPEDWMAFGGWYRDELALRYRPTGHSDRFMYRWLNVSSNTDHERSLRVFNALSSENAPGVCSKCHSIDRTKGENSSLKMNWTGRWVDPSMHPFTSFSHTSHFSLLDEKGCFKCHQLNNDSDFMAGFEDQDPATYSSNFEPMQRSTCSECHTRDKAGDDCLSCHNYHIGTFQPTDLVRSQLTIEAQ